MLHRLLALASPGQRAIETAPHIPKLQSPTCCAGETARLQPREAAWCCVNPHSPPTRMSKRPSYPTSGTRMQLMHNGQFQKWRTVHRSVVRATRTNLITSLARLPVPWRDRTRPISKATSAFPMRDTYRLLPPAHYSIECQRVKRQRASLGGPEPRLSLCRSSVSFSVYLLSVYTVFSGELKHCLHILWFRLIHASGGFHNQSAIFPDHVDQLLAVVSHILGRARD